MPKLWSPRHRFFRYRLALLISLVAIVPLGYWLRFSSGGAVWLHDALGSIAYEMFWIMLGLLLFPAIAPARMAIAVCLATCALEFLQLWQPPFLQALRATLVGRLVLGNTFTGSDFLAYWIGSLAGWGWTEGWRQRLGDRAVTQNHR